MVAFAATILSGIFTALGDLGAILGGLVMILYVLFSLGIIIPMLAVSFRRLHDTDKSAWWLLIGFIPFGGLVLLVFFCLEGTQGDNNFGPDPKNPAGNTIGVF